VPLALAWPSSTTPQEQRRDPKGIGEGTTKRHVRVLGQFEYGG
jgi:hypothetical protein